MNIINNEAIEDINENLEVIWQRLEGIEHYLQMIAEYGVLGRETENAIVHLARHFSKELDDKYKKQLEE